ncbi:MAG TPA: ABC transporter substrate-binding protein [Thermodesulfobacteriota bacterium]|nr:ABC transporter substrate-binding protein [Thermodesulfobacteriota bacterium]
MKKDRSIFVAFAISFVLALFIFSLKTACPQSIPVSQTKSPIKIGWVGPLTGVMAQGGAASIRGSKLAFKEANWEVAGRKVELIIEDDALSPGITVTKVKKLLFDDKINLLIGPWMGASGLAIRDLIDANKLITVTNMCSLATLTQDKFTPYFFRPSFNDSGQAAPFDGWLTHHLGYRNITCISPDTAYGRSCVLGFKNAFEKLGGKVIQEIYPPQGSTMDYAPYLAKVDMSKTDLLFSWLTGSDALRFVKQYSEYGYKKIPLNGSNMIGETYLPEEGDAAVGIYGILHYSQALKTPGNQKFLKDYANEYGGDLTKQVCSFDVHGYEAAKLIVSGLQAVKGKAEDSGALIKALEKVQFESPRGPHKLDEHHNVVYLNYLFRVERVGDKYQNTVLKAFGPIYQGWFDAGYQPPEVPVPGGK